MDNKNIGYLIIGISVLIGFIIYSFNKALTKMVATSCTHGPECPMWGTINFQTSISLGIMIFVLLLGLYLIFSNKFNNKQKDIISKTSQIQFKDSSKILASLDKEEALIYNHILDSKGTIFQSELVDKSKLSKVKVTRLLDKLEGKNIIERKRRGMTNVVILKH